MRGSRLIELERAVFGSAAHSSQDTQCGPTDRDAELLFNASCLMRTSTNLERRTMKTNWIRASALVITGFAVGAFTSSLPTAGAADVQRSDPATQHYTVSIDEVKTNFAYGKTFRDHYAQLVTLSDGTTHEIELTPTLIEGKQTVVFRDNAETTPGGLNSTWRHGDLVIQVRNQEQARDEMIAEGWREPRETK